MGGRLTKDAGPLSRSHTLPSIAAAAATTTSSSGRICTKLRRSSPSNIVKDNTSSASRSIQISPRQGLIMSNSGRDHPHNLTTTTSTEKSFTSLSSEENLRVAFQDEFRTTQISPGKKIEPDAVELMDAVKNSNIEQDQTTIQENRISHGIEIHVVNEDGEVGEGDDGEEEDVVGGKSEKKAVHQKTSTEVDDRNGNIPTAGNTNELDAITMA